MDLLARYGEYDIVDDAGYFAARNHYEAKRAGTVEITVWRGVHRMTAKVPTGWLGVMTTENDPVSLEFHSLMNRLNAMREIPEYMLDREFKGQFEEGPTKIIEKARQLIDKAERESSLTPTQILVARIYMVLDEAPAAEVEQQSKLVAQLLATQPANFIEMIGQDKFFEDKRYRPAVACMKLHLAAEPDDVSARLNMGFAYNHLGMFEEAAAAADYVLDNRLRLSEHGYVVAYQVKALAALGLKDYQKSIQFAEKSFALNRETFDISLLQLAAAQKGDLQRVRAAKIRFQEVLPAKYIEKKLQVDAIEAYALLKSNQRAEARELVLKWKDLDRADGKVVNYWKLYPGGLDVANAWADLMHH
jgi:tetratricopeptide (TPR) repeat protein